MQCIRTPHLEQHPSKAHLTLHSHAYRIINSSYMKRSSSILLFLKFANIQSKLCISEGETLVYRVWLEKVQFSPLALLDPSQQFANFFLSFVNSKVADCKWSVPIYKFTIMAAPTPAERSLISTLRSRVSDLKLEDDGDMYLVRWLRARDLNLAQAEDMLRQHIKWWKENDIDSILKWQPPQDIIDDYPIDIIGHDDDNSPVGVLAFGRWDIRKFIERGQRAEFIRYIDQVYIKALDAMKGRLTPDGVPVTQFVAIYDMDGLSMRTLTSYAGLDAILETLRRFESNHPETMKRGIVINASRMFTLFFTLVKPLLSQRTFGKIEIHGSNQSKWKPIVHEAIPAEILPVYLGGKNFSSILNKAGKVDGKEENAEGLMSVTVGAGEKLPMELDINASNAVLNWSFKTQGYDIGFSLLFNDTDPVVKYSRTSSQEGSYICHRPGKYTLEFDNSFSRMRAKVLYYTISIDDQ